MFNFKELKLNKEVNESDSFVGIRRSKSGSMEFRLPRGFADFPENDFDATKELFFRMYRTFKKFERDHPDKYLDTDKKRKDNIENKNNGYRFRDSEDNDVVLYSKISVIENLLDAYDDLSLDVIERQVGINENIDYAQIDRYLDKAIYQEETNDEHVIYIDSMNLPRNVIQYKSATLIDMFCFILDELNKELDQETDSRVRELSSKFKEQYLSYDQSLFNEDTFEETIIILKDLLQSIDRATAYKDNDYWLLYEAIESFLYGELDMNNVHLDGVFWGISSFWQIWEDMCNTYIFSHPEDYDVIYADTNIKINEKRVSNSNYGCCRIFKKENFENPFFIKFRDQDQNKWLRPDVVIFDREFILPEFVGFNRIEVGDKNGRINFSVELTEYSSKMNRKKYENICNELRLYPHGLRVNTTTVNRNKIIFNSYPANLYLQYRKKISKIAELYLFLDWKYIEIAFLFKENLKLDQDISKQLCYESCLKQLLNNFKAKSYFVIPFFMMKKNDCSEDDQIGFKVEGSAREDFYCRLRETDIDIFKANFYTMQDAYLNND